VEMRDCKKHSLSYLVVTGRTLRSNGAIIAQSIVSTLKLPSRSS
jgi:hypothetical protein